MTLASGLLGKTGHTKVAKSFNASAANTAFLSYRGSDHFHAVGIRNMMESVMPTLSIYIDSEDESLDKSNVTLSTANRLKSMIDRVGCLLYVTTSNHAESKWMPWELGYADGRGKRVAVVPTVSAADYRDGWDFAGQEYLGIYPWIDIHRATDGSNRLWANSARNTYTLFDSWMAGDAPSFRGH